MKSASGSRSKTGSLSRVAARNAVLEVKAKHAASGAKKASSSAAKKASPSFIERYLGHFGVGASSAGAKKVATKKSGSKKTASKRSTTKSLRRAG